jgi:succinoglycan biosynthesis protein ExoM
VSEANSEAKLQSTQICATRVAVAIPTFRRIENLRCLLDRLQGCKTAETLIVVDNDSEASARNLSSQYGVQYHHELRRGISYARNSLIEAANGYDAVAFIDDDECPHPNWLDELLRVQAAYEADLVAGPVLPKFEEPVPEWIKKGKFFDRGRHATGSIVKHAGAGNLLVSRRVIEAMKPCFSEDFALSGGEDTEFIRRARQLGFRVVWADDAIVEESIPAARCSARWLCHRAYSSHCNWTRCLKRSGKAETAIIVEQLAKAIIRFVQGLIYFPAFLLGRQFWVRAQMHIAGACGTVAGVLNQNSQFYRTQPGATFNREDSK